MERHREPWTEEDERELRILYHRAETPVEDISGMLGRTPNAVRMHARRLGLLRWRKRSRPSVRTHFKCSVHGWIIPKDLAETKKGRIVCPTCGKRVKGKAPIPEGLKIYDYES